LKYSILIIAAVVSFFPFYWMFVSSLKTPQEILSAEIEWWPHNPRWMNFVETLNWLKNPTLGRAFLNSIVVTVCSTLLMLFFSSLTAFVLAIYKFRGEGAIFKLILSTMMIPAFLGFIPTFMIVKWLGWVNTYWALIIPGYVSAYTVFLLRQYMITIPHELLEAARLCGCSEFGLFWRIVLPLSKPALAAMGLISAVFTWNDLLWPMMVIYEPEMKTLQQAIAMQLRELYGSIPELHLVAAAMTIATIPLIILTLVTQKHLIKGFTGASYAKR